MKKIRLSTFAKLDNVTQRAVWNWVAKGLVNFERTLTNRILILVDEDNPTIKKRRVAIYARVSSSENKSNLERQKDRLISYANAKGYQIEKVISKKNLFHLDFSLFYCIIIVINNFFEHGDCLA